MGVNDILTSLIVHEVAREQKTGLILSFDGLLGILRILLLLGEIDDGDIGTLSGHENGHRTANAGAWR